MLQWPTDVHVKSLVPKHYKSIFVYSRKMQSKFGIYWEMIRKFLDFGSQNQDGLSN
jgi:hypothetical protein